MGGVGFRNLTGPLLTFPLRAAYNDSHRAGGTICLLLMLQKKERVGKGSQEPNSGGESALKARERAKGRVNSPTSR